MEEFIQKRFFQKILEASNLIADKGRQPASYVEVMNPYVLEVLDRYPGSHLDSKFMEEHLDELKTACDRWLEEYVKQSPYRAL